MILDDVIPVSAEDLPRGDGVQRARSSRKGRASVRRAGLVLALIAACLVPQRLAEEIPPIAIRFFPILPPGLEQSGLDRNAYRKAVQYFQVHQHRIQNRNYLTIIDYTKPSSSRRLFLIDLRNRRVESHLVAHGKNSGWVYATQFSNEVGSLKSCRGFFLTGEKYMGKQGPSLRLIGLDRHLNDNALVRGIVIHGAPYINYGAVLRNRGRLGRSWGCPAVSPEVVGGLVERIKNGSLVYIHART